MSSDGEPIHEVTSISGVGFGFLALIVGVHRSWITRQEGIERANRMLRSLLAMKRFHGAFPHFVQTSGGKTIPFAKFDDGGDLVETALLVQALICTREFFGEQTSSAIGLRQSIAAIVDTVEWDWFTQGKAVAASAGAESRSCHQRADISQKQDTGDLRSPVPIFRAMLSAPQLKATLRQGKDQNSSQLSGAVFNAALPENAALILPPSARAGEAAGLSATDAVRTGAEASP